MKRATTASSTTQLGPGEYLPDIPQLRVEDLPQPKIVKERRVSDHLACPRCHRLAYRDRTFTRHLHDFGDLLSGRPRELRLTYSQHYCSACRCYFQTDVSDLAWPRSHYTRRVVAMAVRLVAEDGLPYRAASWHLWRDHRVFVPFATLQNWTEAASERASERMLTDYLDWALADFSGYITVDELYDGPFCVLSIVDNRTFKRLFYEVLDRDPTQADLLALFRRFQAILSARNLAVLGITTDASNLYPAAVAEVFGEVPHQVCQFHILADLTQAVLRAVAAARKTLTASKPKLGRGRPAKHARPLVSARQRIEQKVSDLFAHRHLFVQHHLSPSERETLQRITRGLPQLRVLREIMDEVYRLFDRRCRTDTALAKLAKLRQRVQRFTQVSQILKALFSANVEKALTFLDDRLLPATSNAVERGNRRYRKMQKTVYRVRVHAQVVGRLALDMWREAFAQGHALILQLLRQARAASALLTAR